MVKINDTMRIIVVSIIYFLSSTCLILGQQNDALSNIKQYVLLSEEKIDLLEIGLKVSQAIHPELDANSCRTYISNIVNKAKNDNIDNAKPKDKILILSSTIHKSFGITVPDKPSSQTGPEYGMIDFVLNKKKETALDSLHFISSSQKGLASPLMRKLSHPTSCSNIMTSKQISL